LAIQLSIPPSARESPQRSFLLFRYPNKDASA